MLNVLRTYRLIVLLLWTLIMAPLQLLSVLLHLPTQRWIPILFHRFVGHMLHLTIDVRGAPARERPVLFAVNHSSWLDIVVLSTIVPTSFIAKQEIASWPGFSILAKLQRSVFIERKRGKAKEGVSGIQKRLLASDNLVLFGEGGTGDGNTVRPFKSSMFSAAETVVRGKTPLVQPVSIAYTHLDGFPLGRRARHRLTWYGSMSLGGHLWGVLGQGNARVAVEFHPAVRIADFASRKELAAACQKAVAQSHSRALTGRLLPRVAGAHAQPAA